MVSEDNLSEALLDRETDLGEAVSRDSSPVFIATARQPQLQRAAHMCRYGDQLLVVVADHDQGKSYFLGKLVEELKGSTQLTLVKSRSLESPAELLSQILSLFVDQLPDNQDMSIGALLARIRVCLTQDSLTAPVVIIDDANWLTDEVLSMLLSLLSAGFESAPLKIVMAGNRELVARLDRLGGLEAMIYDLELALPTVDEWHRYAVSVLGLDIGLAGVKVIVDDSRREFSRVLDEFNHAEDPYVDPLLDEAPAQPKLGLSPVHMIAIVSLLAVGVGVFVIGDRLSSGSTEQAKPPEVVVIESNQPQPALPLPSSAQNIDNARDIEPVSSAANQPDISEVSASTELEQGAETQVSEQVATDFDEYESQAKQPVIKEASDKPLIEDPLVTPVLAKSPTAQAAVKAPVQQPSKASVLSRPDSHYVLQIMAAQSRESLETFLKSQRNRDSIELVTLQRNGQDWFVLLQGDYENRQQARSSIASLPENQQKNGAWPRSISEIKANFSGN